MKKYIEKLKHLSFWNDKNWIKKKKEYLSTSRWQGKIIYIFKLNYADLRTVLVGNLFCGYK